MPSGMLSYDQFKFARAKMGKLADKEKYRQYKRKYALLNASDSESGGSEDTDEEEEEEEEEDPGAESKKGSGLDRFALAMAKVKSTGDSVKNLQKAQKKEGKEAAQHRRDVFHDMVVKGHVNPFQGLDKQTLARDRFRRRMAELMPLTATLGSSGDNQHMKLSTLMQNLRRRHKWGRWRLKAGEVHVWVCNIPGHAYTTANVEVFSQKKGQPTTAEIKAGVEAAGLTQNGDVPTEEDRKAILRDLIDAKEEEEEARGKGKAEPKGKEKAEPKGKEKAGPKGKEAMAGKGKEPMAPKRQGLKVAEARKRAAELEHGRLKVGDHALLMASEDHEVEDEEKRWKAGTPDVPTSWYKDDLTPQVHTPLLCGVVVETVPKKPAWHFGHQVAGGLPRDQLCIKITEFHWTLYDPVHQDRVKKALLYLFGQVEEKVPEKAEFKRHLDDFLKGRFATGSLLCCVPWEHATQRYDDGKELLYYHSGKPDGLKVPKPAGTSAEDEDDSEEMGTMYPRPTRRMMMRPKRGMKRRARTRTRRKRLLLLLQKAKIREK
ncbi:hypothetical protein CYMTET_28469 [Cymbomonas tetramitiformis]|uniref:Uncharacterized protein n=1 Tax=Cymbomonas tetramitiformis TaxID=36881 RepID=A0AAE0KW71_9CHLO|nr:hypothetical protein CYMTET_28469 [Cymbomonas tetramitiformis]